jgi:hypothetical protein
MNKVGAHPMYSHSLPGVRCFYFSLLSGAAQTNSEPANPPERQSKPTEGVETETKKLSASVSKTRLNANHASMSAWSPFWSLPRDLDL